MTTIGTMFGDVLQSLFRRPVTRLYPVERRATPSRLRGQVQWDPENCTGCGLCSKECPAEALEVITLDKKAKQFVMRYHVDRCTFCAQCVHSCRFNCLDMASTRWELAALEKGPFTVYYGEEANIQQVLASGEKVDA